MKKVEHHEPPSANRFSGVIIIITHRRGIFTLNENYEIFISFLFFAFFIQCSLLQFDEYNDDDDDANIVQIVKASIQPLL